MLDQLLPIVFPPGAGGHFFYSLLTLHDDIMPMSKEHCMKKKLSDKNLNQQVERILETITEDHGVWQKHQPHDYYIQPPKYERTISTEEWIKSFPTGDLHFIDKINQPRFIHGTVVHHSDQFKSLQTFTKWIWFDNFELHVKKSLQKVSDISIQFDYDNWVVPEEHNVFVVDCDKFYYVDWLYAEGVLRKCFNFIGKDITEQQIESSRDLWYHYRKIH
tara:strand:- start:562 stop:1215 length:654 start_codon:yes stop_codon:yes gene_type:complete